MSGWRVAGLLLSRRISWTTTRMLDGTRKSDDRERRVCNAVINRIRCSFSKSGEKGTRAFGEARFPGAVEQFGWVTGYQGRRHER